jgi:hypothetical protein
VGYNDHSRGVRDLLTFASDQWLLGVLPDMAFHVVEILDPDGQTMINAGAIFDARHGYRKVRLARRIPGVSAQGDPDAFDLQLEFEDGSDPLVLAGEVLHTAPITITNANENLNGHGWELPDDPLLFTECQIRFTAPDGSVGYANRELGIRRSQATPRTD